MTDAFLASPAWYLPLALAVAAPFIGSFLAVVAIRLPKSKAFLYGRSACDACGRRLGPRDLVPLASFAILKGRCRNCGARIDPLHPLLEAGALVVALWAATLTSGWILVASAVLGWTLLTLAAIDWRHGILPNVLTLPLIVLGFGVAFEIDDTVLVDHVIGAVVAYVGFVALAWLYRRLRGREGLGGGDAKLAAAGGAWLSWSGLPTMVLFASMIALAGVLIRALRGKAIASTDRLAFGPPLALGIWLVWLYGPLMPG